MLFLIAKAVALMCVVFGVMAWFGTLLAGPKRKASRPRYSAFDFETADVLPFPQGGVVVEDKKPAPQPAPKPVAYLDAAAEHFTSGVIVRDKSPEKHVDTPRLDTSRLDSPKADKPAYTPMQPSPRLDGLPANVIIERLDPSTEAGSAEASNAEVRRASTLATMTPESVEAAVQQAGSGLEPVCLSAPQGTGDDLTLISGISSAYQAALNEIGIYHFWQVAGWSPENVAWVAKRTESQRIARENWMSQAARLAGLNENQSR